MFWKLPPLSAPSPIEAILDKENFVLEELLDEEDIIQECKALNARLINFLRDRTQVEQLLRYIVEESLDQADSKRSFKFPFIACEIFTCEIDVILKTLVEEEELMNILFSFLESSRHHSALLAGYFSKVVVCLMVRKTIPLMNYVKAHNDVFGLMVDLIGITSIMEVLVRLVGADDHNYPNSTDVSQWLADSNLLEMIVDKLSPSCPPEVHANAAETLCTITRNSPSPLASKLSSPSFVARVFGHALEDSLSKSALVHSLSVCISLLDPKRSIPSSMMYSFRTQHMYEAPLHVDSDTIGAMLPKLGDLLMLLNVSSDKKVLPTTYGELRPPLGKHRLKIVEFISVLLKSANEVAQRELINSGTIHRILDLFFEYPYNNALHHYVESIVYTCLESKNSFIIDHLFQDYNLAGKMLQTDKQPTLSIDVNLATLPAAGKRVPRMGNIGHLTRISNKLIQMGSNDSRIRAHLEKVTGWSEWQASVLQDRNRTENVHRWACGRPTALHDQTRDSDEEDAHDRDYDVSSLANNLSQAFRYTIYDNKDAEEGHGALDRDDEYFDDESAEVVISSLRLGDDQGSLFTNSNWFAFQDDRIDGATSISEMMEEINLNGSPNSGGGGSNSNSGDEVVVGAEDEELVADGKGGSNPNILNGFNGRDTDFFRFETSDDDLFGDRPIPEWVAWGDATDLHVERSNLNPFLDPPISSNNISSVEATSASPPPPPPPPSQTCDATSPPDSVKTLSASDPSPKPASVPSLFEEDVEFVGVELVGTEKAMEHALKEGIVGEAAPLKRSITVVPPPENDNPDEGSGSTAIKEFNDANYWRVDHEVAVLE